MEREKNFSEIAEKINVLGEFCGKRDIAYLSGEALQEKYGFSKADLLILYGGSIPYGCDVAGRAVLKGISDRFMIAGGEGHTTESLRQKIRTAYPQIDTEGKMESDIMYEYMMLRYGIKECMIERESTNCGNNVTNVLKLMEESGYRPKSIIIIQDSTMQLRMEAGFRKHCRGRDIELIQFAAYNLKVREASGNLEFDRTDIWGMWDMEQYISLLLGEIPRLTDDNRGYGPAGKNYIAHVDIPKPVKEAFCFLTDIYGDLIRRANPVYSD